MMIRYSPEQIYSPIQRKKNASAVQLKWFTQFTTFHKSVFQLFPESYSIC